MSKKIQKISAMKRKSEKIKSHRNHPCNFQNETYNWGYASDDLLYCNNVVDVDKVVPIIFAQ